MRRMDRTSISGCKLTVKLARYERTWMGVNNRSKMRRLKKKQKNGKDGMRDNHSYKELVVVKAKAIVVKEEICE